MKSSGAGKCSIFTMTAIVSNRRSSQWRNLPRCCSRKNQSPASESRLKVRFTRRRPIRFWRKSKHLYRSLFAKSRCVVGNLRLGANSEKDFSKHTAVIDLLASCAARSKKIKIRYLALNTNHEESRLLAPYAVYFDPDGATLKANRFRPEIRRSAKAFSAVERISRHRRGTGEETFARPDGFQS